MTRAFLMVGVAQPDAWALSVRNNSYLSLPAPAPEEVVGAFVALYALPRYDLARAGVMVHQCGVSPPPHDALSEAGDCGAIVAAGRVVGVEPPRAGSPAARWYTGPHAVRLDWVLRLVPVPGPPPPAPWTPVPENLLAQVQVSCRAALAVVAGLVSYERELRGLTAKEQLEYTERVVDQVQQQHPSTWADVRRRFLGVDSHG